MQDPPDPVARARALIALAAAYQDSGDMLRARDIALDIAAAAREAQRTDLLAQAAGIRIMWGFAGFTDETGEALVLEALDAIGSSDHGHRARLLSTLAFYRSVYLGRGWELADMVEEAMREARHVEGPATLAEVLSMGCFVMQGSPDVAGQHRYVEELVDMLPRVPAAVWKGLEESEPVSFDEWRGFYFERSGLSMTVDRHRPVVALQTGDVAAFDAGIAVLEERFEAEGAWMTRALASLWRGLRALMDGRFADAEEQANAILAITDDINFTNSWAGQIFAIRHDQGRLEEVRPLFSEVAEQTPGLVVLQSLVALAAVEAGDRDEALSILRRLAGEGAEPLPPNSTLPAMLAYLATTAALLEVSDGAEVLLEQLEPYAGQLLVIVWGVGCPGAADRFIGMLLTVLGRHDEAVARFEAALALERSVSAPALVARTLYWYARGAARARCTGRRRRGGRAVVRVRGDRRGARHGRPVNLSCVRAPVGNSCGSLIARRVGAFVYGNNQKHRH